MKITEQFFVLKNLKTGKFVFNFSNAVVGATFTPLAQHAKCFHTFEQAASTIEEIRVFFNNKERAARAKEDEYQDYHIERAIKEYEKHASQLVICKLKRTVSISQGVEL